MDKLNNLSESELFSKGVKLPNDHFTGTAWLSMLVEDDHIFNCPIGYVSFEPSAISRYDIWFLFTR